MQTAVNQFRLAGFVKQFILPAVWIFAIPLFSLFFFQHTKAHYDASFQQDMAQRVLADPTLTPEQREKALAFFRTITLETLLKNKEFAQAQPWDTWFYYTTFVWMIFLAWVSILSGLGILLFAGVSGYLALRSQRAQYLSLLANWHTLRLYGALQTIALGLMVTALSFWITAWWFHIYYLKLILIAGLVSLAAVGMILVAIFKSPPKGQLAVEGKVIPRDDNSPLWQRLNAICEKVGTAPPDQIIAGIDSNFFVTDQPVQVGETRCAGRTLFVSLALLKHLKPAEADAVLAHEMAHFSGNDTYYSSKIGPLQQRFQNYLQALGQNPITLPYYYFLRCIHTLQTLSLLRHVRQREHRADAIAAQMTSPTDAATALLRTTAYMRFRNEVEGQLFNQQEVLEAADISGRIEREYPAYSLAFASRPDIGTLDTPHPFDDHPTLAQRFEGLGVTLDPAQARLMLATGPDGAYGLPIPDAAAVEQELWQKHEQRFRDYHESTLPYRYLPETPQEREIVEREFPKIDFEGSDGLLEIDFEKVTMATWPDSVPFSQITECTQDDKGVLTIKHTGTKPLSRIIRTKKFAKELRPIILEAFGKYYGRYKMAAQHKAAMNAR